MRTGVDPRDADVLRSEGKPKDQLPDQMFLEQRKASRPRTRRNRRKSDWY